MSPGYGSDIFLWRTDVAAGSCEPLSIVVDCKDHTLVPLSTHVNWFLIVIVCMVYLLLMLLSVICV